MDLRRHLAVRVELRNRGLQDVGLRLGLTGLRVGHQFDALDHPPAPHLEHLDDAARRARLHADRIAIAEARGRHPLLAVAELPECAHRVAQVGGPLEALLLGRLPHVLLQPRDEFRVPPLEQQPGAVHRRLVLPGGADRVDAGGHAPADLMLEARPVAFPGDVLVARAQPEQAVRQADRPARQARGQEGAGVQVAVALGPPRHQHARKRLAGRELQERVVLVVAQLDVVARQALLDEVVLEDQRLHRRIGDDVFEGVGLSEQRVDAGRRAPGHEVAAQAVAQHGRFTHVEGVAAAPQEQVDPRLLGCVGDLLLEVLNWHGLDLCVQSETLALSIIRTR